MQKKGEISEYREKLDKTLSSPELADHESLKSLLRNQLSGSSPECNANILDKRTADVSKLLSMLRSVSMTDASSSSHGDWKIKQDLEDCRVMYRQGLEGSPFHTLLVEGYMDSPLEDCLCVSWETALYKNWWPQFAFPPFKILQGTCLHKVRTGEQVCLVRMKVPWPLSEREVIVHYFLFEYFKDGLVVVLLNSISDLDSIGVSAKDMAKKVIPEATSAVRIDLVGGFALQKVTSQRSFVRVIGELDIKLDLVPPSLMNFIARQIVGKGFKLYKKAAGSVAKLDEGFSRALADPLYINIRQAMYSTNKATEEEQELETENKHENDEDETVHCRRGILEIEEEKEEEEEEEYFEESVSSEERNVNGNIRRQFSISTEVEQALGTLDRAINMVRNITPVKEDEELPPNKAEDQRKQVSVLEIFENVPQRSQRQYFSTSRVSVTQEGSYFSQEDNKREKETGDDHLNKERERHQMNKTKKLVASISTLLTRRTSHPSSSTLRCNPLATIASNSQTHLNPVKPLAVSIRRLQFSGRGFSSESSDKRSSSGCCWNCGFSSDKAAFLFCDSCRSIQPVDDSVDYFQIFGLEKKYELEGGSLEGKYKDWQKKLHPDLVHNKSQKERDYAADQSAKVTEACRTLTKRLSRAMYIMKLNGKNVNEEETVTDPTLLMEMMELREAIAEADDSKELNQIQSQVQENLKQWSDSFADNFESQRFDEAVNCIRRMTYYEKACEEIVKKL